MKDYNFIYIKKNGRSRTYSFSKRIYKYVTTIIFSLLIIFIVSLSLNFLLFNQVARNVKLVNNNKKLVKNIVKIEVQLSRLYDALSDVAQRDQNIKMMLSESLGYNNLGQGGTTSDNLFDILTSGKKENLEVINKLLSNLYVHTQIEKQNQIFIEANLETKSKLLAATPSIIPVDGWVSSGFGPRRDPFTGRYEFHKGIDVVAWVNTPVHAPADGIVVYARKARGYGNVLILNHGYGISTVYGHLNKFNVILNQKVKRGDVIAYVGNTGRSTGPHLHYEVRVNGVPTNPMKYIQ